MTVDPATNLLGAEARAAAARERLSGTVAQLQSRLDPKLLAREASEKGALAARAGVEQARRNPNVVVGVAGAAMLLMLRKRIASILRRRRARRPVPAQPIAHSPHPVSKD